MARWRTFEKIRELGSGEGCFDASVERLMTWQVQRGAGFDVEPATRVTQGAHHSVIVRMFGVRLTAPVTIREVVDAVENGCHVRGFVYETRPGHPERGHEAFLVEHDLTSDAVRFVVRATSKPGVWWVRLGGPVARVAQDAATRRYLAAIQP